MKTTYPHPLDYAVGIKHVITPLKINKEYRLSAESFYVKEIVDLNSLDFNTEKGNYVVFKVVKKNIDTLSTARVLEKYLGLPHGNVIILGLKDKNSTSTQYFFVKKELVREYIKINECIEIGSNVEACIIGFIGRKPRKEHLLGNKFRIILEASEKEYYMSKEILNKIIEIGVPSYYGYQRFGVKRINTHILGKYLVLKRIDLFSQEFLHRIYPLESVESIEARITNTYTSAMYYERLYSRIRNYEQAIRTLLDRTKNIFVDAYASYLYNLLLNKVIENKGFTSLNKKYPTIGCSEYKEYYGDLMVIEGITDKNVIEFNCWYRIGMFKPRETSLYYRNGLLEINFVLDKGFYASIVLRELFKENLIL